MTIFNFISLFGGLALFLYGMRLMGDGLKAGSSAAMKKAMEKLANNPVVGFMLEGRLIFEIVASLVYRVSPRTAGATQRNPTSKDQKRITKKE